MSCTIAVVFSVSLKLYSLYQSNPHPLFEGAPASSGDAPQSVIPTIHSNTSISFYTICGASQKITTADLRGRFWEWQLKYFTGNYSLHYLSDGPISVNGIDFLVLPEGRGNFDDSQFCIRTPESWRHFIKHNGQTKWYFRGTHDTFVNMTSLAELISDLEQKGDPMTTFNFAFNFHEYNHQYYPHGGTGWLFSNYAVRMFLERVNHFVLFCQGCADDVALPGFFKLFGLDVMNFQTPQFIVTWPNHLLDVIFQKKWDTVPDCPDVYRLYPAAKGLLPGRCRTAASIHMHRVPMDQAWQVLVDTPDNFAVTYTDPDTPIFCKLK
jgi:hypothetical protein